MGVETFGGGDVLETDLHVGGDVGEGGGRPVGVVGSFCGDVDNTPVVVVILMRIECDLLF